MSPELATLNGKTRTRQLPKAPAADLPSRGRIVLRSRTRKREQLPARKLDALPRRCSVFASAVPSSGECCRGRPSVSSLPCQRCRAAFRPEVPDLFYRNNMKNWAPALCEERSDVTMETCSAFLEKMYYEYMTSSSA